MRTITKAKAAALVGSYSTATLRAPDLIPAAIGCLSRIGGECAPFTQRWVNLLNGVSDNPQGWANITTEQDETSAELYMEIVDEINSILPEGFYYGSTEGNGSDIGIWQTDAE